MVHLMHLMHLNIYAKSRLLTCQEPAFPQQEALYNSTEPIFERAQRGLAPLRPVHMFICSFI